MAKAVTLPPPYKFEPPFYPWSVVEDIQIVHIAPDGHISDDLANPDIENIWFMVKLIHYDRSQQELNQQLDSSLMDCDISWIITDGEGWYPLDQETDSSSQYYLGPKLEVTAEDVVPDIICPQAIITTAIRELIKQVEDQG